MKRSLFPAVMVLVVLSFCALSYTTSAFALPVRGDLQNTGNFQIKTLPQGVFAWKLETGSNITGAPVVDGNTVYVGNHKGEVYALDINNGSVRWKFQCDGSILGSVAVDKDKVYVGTFAGRVYALNRSSGLVAWSTKVDGPVMACLLYTSRCV